MPHPPLAIIGFGNMGQAILRGGIAAGVLDSARVVVAELDAAKRNLAESLGVRCARPSPADALVDLSNLERTLGEGQILLAIKPQMLNDVSKAFAHDSRIVISILAGTSIAAVQAAMGGRSRVIRAMPNLPASIGQGATAISVGAGATPGDAGFAFDLFRAIGPLVLPLEEALMDAFTAVAGSGPAYLFYLAQGMIDGAVATGFSQSDAERVVRQTLLGAADLLSRSPETPQALRAAVTSKRGTTAAAVEVLDEGGVLAQIQRAIVKARDRGREIGGGLNNLVH